MSEFTEQQVREIEEVEAKYGTYGGLVNGALDPELTDFQSQHCLRVMNTGIAAFHAELAAEHGEQYPLSALAEKIDAGIAKHTIQRDEVTR
nr:hypothetical protein [uncultured Halomonas sp.]